MRSVHVQSVLPEEDVLALKIKTGKTSVKDALSVAVYYYLENCKDTKEDKIK
jgi:Family of unknown function (DUF5371)